MYMQVLITLSVIKNFSLALFKCILSLNVFISKGCFVLNVIITIPMCHTHFHVPTHLPI